MIHVKPLPPGTLPLLLCHFHAHHIPINASILKIYQGYKVGKRCSSERKTMLLGGGEKGGDEDDDAIPLLLP